ncbi:MAG: hypothetical protein AB7F09_06620 [Parvibaculaceae bacterium]
MVQFEERNPVGAGVATIYISGFAVAFRADDSAPLIWALDQRKCADGAFLTFNKEGAHLHIVELKGKVSSGNWPNVVAQMEGMYLTALAVARLLKVLEVKSVTCYLALKNDAMKKPTQAIFLKTPTGSRSTLGRYEDWVDSKIRLPLAFEGSLVRATRDSSGNASFTAS